ncbi:MAG: putative monooxygenase [Acidimicrobiales bacterium]|nr:MAG: NAD(P)/FAD-dependent oxidoreductase [Actinomycetota bacterium]MBV6509736.1 putative monooxygenase [Acidimicrobiales bacterium]RIK04870.1 MAG: NAD(P)/FAD-dependent oxidoreductase [Acidobacteriota bacterium]
MNEPRLRFGIVGAGMAGILSAIKLKEAGLDDITVYEKADRVGGTWRENTYPGLSCDVPSHLYSYSFDLNPDWSHLFSPGAEIQAYFERIAGEHDLLRCIRFSDEVVSCEFTGGRWHLATASGHRDEVDVVIAATGVLHHPKYPEIDGLDSFGGPTFHSARWDHSIPLAGRRVGIIGTGSTAVQIVSAIVDEVDNLSLFQRTAQWILPQANPAYSEEEREAFRREPQVMADLHENLSKLFADGFANAVVDAESPQMKLLEEACRANLEQNVHDPDLRDKLRPDYRAACKRLIISPDFYEAIAKPNAELVTEGIEAIVPDGVRTRDGRLHELDVLVLATGFKVDAFMRPMAITGRNGRGLDEAWRDRPQAYLSISIPGFPNLFMLNGPNGPVGNFSLIEVAELQFGYIMQLIDCIRSGRCREISASASALEAFEAEREEAAKGTVWMTGCRSWYLDDRGIPAVWPWTFDRFRAEMSAPDISDYELVS